MQLAQYAKSYKAAAVTTAPPGQLVLMLFDGSLRFLAAARYGFDVEEIARRHEQIHNNLIRTQKILCELQCSLDLAAGGEFAKTMWALYDFMRDQLQRANLKKEKEPIGVVEKIIGELRDAWAQMLEQSVAQAA